jgi:hypothetical protein
MPQFPGINPAIITEENEEDTAKGENYASCFLNYFIYSYSFITP